jgi:hypothetical protein
MTVAHRVKATVGPNGSLELKDVPFAAGEQVKVVILAERRDDQ